jgi:hypothetical protein
VTEEEGFFKYLGHPLRRNPRLANGYPSANPTIRMSAQEKQRLYFLLLCTSETFTLPSGDVLASPRLLSIAIKTVIFARSLYPTPVMDIEYSRLDTPVFQAVRRLLGLPRTTPSALLWLELSLPPSKLYAEKRTLHFAREFTRSRFFQQVVLPNKDAFLSCTTGAPRHMQTILRRYDKSLEDLGFPGIVGASEEEQSLHWNTHVKEEFLRLGFLPHLTDTLDRYPASMRTHIHRVCFTIEGDVIDGFPPYIKLGHRHARVGLVFKNYYLRHFHYGSRAACMWCATPEAECGAHLVECEAMPPTLAPKLHETLVLIAPALEHPELGY